ncbi:MAG: hypothetical protein DSZ12_01595, partial [Sulfurovum sp.]
MEISAEEKIDLVSRLMTEGEFEQSFIVTLAIYKKYSNPLVLFNVAALLVDIGQMGKNKEASRLALKIMNDNENIFLSMEEIDKNIFYYNFGNAKSNFIEDRKDLDISNNLSFDDIEDLIELKTYYWKAINFSKKKHKKIPPKYIVNFGNSLKRQFRLVEA